MRASDVSFFCCIRIQNTYAISFSSNRHNIFTFRSAFYARIEHKRISRWSRSCTWDFFAKDTSTVSSLVATKQSK